jgi:putative mycofactocin binding protein MftB
MNFVCFTFGPLYGILESRDRSTAWSTKGRLFVSQSTASYRLIPEVKIRRESFGGILYKYGCADRGAMSFINSPQLIEFLLVGQQQYQGDLSAAVESRGYSVASKEKLYRALDDLARRGYILIVE